MGLVNKDGSFVKTDTVWDEGKGAWVSQVHGVSSAHGGEALPESIPEAVAPEVVKQDRKAYKRSYMREYMRKRRALKEVERTGTV